MSKSKQDAEAPGQPPPKTQKDLGVNAPTTYAECAFPFDSTDEANETLNAFFEEFYQLRIKHKIANVSVIIMDSIGDSGPFLSSFHCGSAMEEETMAAWHMGRAGAERQDRVRRALESACKAVAGHESRK